MTGDGQSVRHRAELYVRSLQPDGYCMEQSSTLDRIDALVERGLLTERQVQVCGYQVPATFEDADTEIGQRIVRRLGAFQMWASMNDCSLTPAIEVREISNSFTGTEYRAVRLPAMLLAEYREGELACVVPHYDGESVRTVVDRVSELESGDPERFEPLTRSGIRSPETRTEPATDSGSCSDLPVCADPGSALSGNNLQ